MVAEADWAPRDHVAIAYALAARWRWTVRMTFASLVRAYCSGFGKWTPEYLRLRLTWVRALNAAGDEPTGWQGGKYGPWERYKAKWLATLERADAWYEGRLSDPCRGRATLWGGVGDPKPPKGWIKIDCGKTYNTFYGRR